MGQYIDRCITAKHWYNSGMGMTPDPSSSSLVKWLAHPTMSDYDILRTEQEFSWKYLIT